ncbi:MAG: ATP synthase F1 subunit epsilon, partial [Chloroflexi bacterium]|nr:ATP synthase F1 subunit epsilon [Chloroflexota bacterium]
MASEQPQPSGPATASEPQRLHVTIVTGDKTAYAGWADAVRAPAVRGQIGILPRHAPLLAGLQAGELLVRNGPDELVFAVGGGFLEVRDDEVIVLADSVERAEEIDVARAEAARRRARSLVERNRDRPEASAAREALDRSRARLKVAQRARRPSR